MKKMYEIPKIELVILGNEEILTTSPFRFGFIPDDDDEEGTWYNLGR